jgi:hypothetical protein
MCENIKKIKRGVVVICSNEVEQQRIYDELNKLKLSIKKHELEENVYNRDSDFQKKICNLLNDDVVLPVTGFPFIKGKPMQTSTNRLGFPTFTIFDRNMELTGSLFEQLRQIGNDYGYVYYSVSIYRKKVVITFQSLPF